MPPLLQNPSLRIRLMNSLKGNALLPHLYKFTIGAPFSLHRTFNMDGFKRCFSNESEDKSIAYFWENFDSQNYSIWFGEYTFEEELTQVFMSCNLISGESTNKLRNLVFYFCFCLGMFQRLDKMRKQAFASVCLFGVNNNSSISGIWIWRGQDLAFTVSNNLVVDLFKMHSNPFYTICFASMYIRR